jgi:hypothetical protein
MAGVEDGVLSTRSRRIIYGNQETNMDNTVDVTIPVDAEAAKALHNAARREAAGRYLSSLLTGGRIQEVLADAIAEAKLEARANGLTDQEIDAEFADWQAERRV